MKRDLVRASGHDSNASSRFFATQCAPALAVAILCALTHQVSAGVNSWTSLGPEGGYVRALVIPDGPSRRAYALSPSWLFRSSDGGETWTRVGSLEHNLFDFAVDPVDSNRLLLAADGILLLSTDGGTTTAHIARPSAELVAQIEFSHDGALLYAAGERVVHRSSNLGATWQAGAEVTTVSNVAITSLHPDRNNANRLIAVLSSGSAAMTSDAGDHWAPFALPAGATLNALAFARSGGPRIWVATSKGVWYTDNFGAGWTATALPGVTWAVGIDPMDPSIVHAQQGTLVYRSTDSGAHWTRDEGVVGLGRINNFAFDPLERDRVLFGGSNGVWGSVDTGANWSPRNRGLIATLATRFAPNFDRTYFAVGGEIYYVEAGGMIALPLDPAPLRQALPPVQSELLLTLYADLGLQNNAHRLFAGGSGGKLARSEDAGQSWTQLNDPLLVPSVNDVGVASDNRRLLIAGTSNGIIRSIDAGDHWSTTTGIPPNTTITNIDFDLALIAYAAGAGHIYRTVDGGLTWVQADSGISAAIISNVLNYGDTAYASTSSGPYKTINGGLSWTRLPSQGSGLYGIEMGRSGLYAFRDQTLLRSVDGGTTWTELPRPTPGVRWAGLAADRRVTDNDRGRLLASTAFNGVQTYTVATNLSIVAAGKPTSPPAVGARTELDFTITNHGPHAANVATLHLNAQGRNLFNTPGSNCAKVNAGPSSSEINCYVEAIGAGSSALVKVAASFETEGPISLTASVESTEAELVPADNTINYSVTYDGPPGSEPQPGGAGGGTSMRQRGGGGEMSWWFLLVLATVAAGARRSEAHKRADA